MYKKANLLGLYCESPVHAGSGSDLGVIDLPIQREKHTDYPIFQGSTVKGALRDSFDSAQAIDNALTKGIFSSFNINQNDQMQEAVDIVFGSKKDGDENQFAAALSFTDARLLLFPMKSVKNTFVWITSLGVLNRLKRDLELTETTPDWNLPQINEEGIIATQSELDEYSEKQVVIEEYTFDVEKSKEVNNIATWIADNIFPSQTSEFWKEKLQTDLVILNDDDFSDFVKMSTDVVARTKINSDTKVVENGALWYEENVPADTLFYSLVLANDVLKPSNSLDQLQAAEQVVDFFAVGLQDRIQLGGNQTIGRGIINTELLKGGTE